MGSFFKYLGGRKEEFGYQSNVLIWEFLWVVGRLWNEIEGG